MNFLIGEKCELLSSCLSSLIKYSNKQINFHKILADMRRLSMANYLILNVLDSKDHSFYVVDVLAEREHINFLLKIKLFSNF